MPGTDAETLLRGSGLRVTRPHLGVLAALSEHPRADTGSVIGPVRDHLGRVSHQGVYYVLRALTDACLLPRIQPAASVVRHHTCPACSAAPSPELTAMPGRTDK